MAEARDLAQLIAGCQEGRRKAQRALYEQYADAFFAICLRYAASEAEAEDFLQEAFVRIFKCIRDYRHEGSFEGWMRRIVVNTTISELRRQHPQWVSLEEEAGSDVHKLSVEDIFAKIAAEDLLIVIQQLPAGYRTVFNLYALEGYNHQEIGDLCGISAGTSKSQYARARQMLQRMLAASYPEYKRKIG